MRNLDHALTLSLIDKASGPAKRIGSAGAEMADKLDAGRKAIAALGRENKAIDRLQGLERKLGSTSTEMAKARAETARLGREMASTANPTAALSRQFEAARKRSDQLKGEHRQQRDQLRGLREQLRGAGLDTRNLGAAQAGIASKIQATTQQMNKLADASARVEAAQGRHDKQLQRAAHATIAAAGIQRVGQGIMGMLSSPLDRARGVEAAKGELQSIDIANTGVIIDRGREISRRLAGVDTESFVRAAYDIKSGVSTLTDSGVAEMTTAAAVTAKATKADIGQMTSLFASGHAMFKDRLFGNASDAQFAEAFSASLAHTVKSARTTGAEMQQAIQSMGAGLAASGVSLSEQLATLGALQTKGMSGGMAGTTLKAIERTAATANAKFADMGFGIRTLDEKGNMQSLPVMLEQMQAAFGENYTTEIGGMVKEAFGSDEAKAFFAQMWGQQDVLRSNIAELEKAQKLGMAFTDKMAANMDRNFDARLKILNQRWNLIQERIGERLIPVLERVLPVVETVVDAIGRVIDANPGLTTGILGVAGVVGGLALIAAPVIVSVAALGTTLTWLGVQAAKANAMAAMGGGGGVAGKLGKAGALRGMGGKLGVAGALTVGALSIGSTLMDSEQSGVDKAANITKDVGTIGGGLVGAAKGAALGAAIGSVVPILGTAVGGILGSIVGGIGGSMAGNWLGEKAGGGIRAVAGWFGNDGDTALAGTPADQVQAAAAASQSVGIAPQPSIREDNRSYTLQIAQQPGESEENLARRIMDMLKRQDDAHVRGALYDPI